MGKRVIDEFVSRSRRYYWNHRGKVLEDSRLRRGFRRKRVQEYKLNKACTICGYNRCANALCFHHNGHKEFAIADSVGAYTPMGKIAKEIDNCTVLCRNCHAELHEGEGQSA